MKTGFLFFVADHLLPHPIFPPWTRIVMVHLCGSQLKKKRNIYIYIYIYTISFQTFFVEAFKIVVDS